MSRPSAKPARIKVFVHLARGYDSRRWEEKWLRGQLVGFNARSPYGYHLANDLACDVTFSKDGPESLIGLSLRGIFRVLMGFDLAHAWRNRALMRAADIVWTHTESQSLAVALVRKTMRKGRRPKLLAQTVWLIDMWPSLSALKRVLYRWLLQDADILTFLSPLNKNVAKTIFPGKRCEFVRFGITTEIKQRPAIRSPCATMRVLSVGNDRHRDWESLIEAFGNLPGTEVRLVTKALSPQTLAAVSNFEIIAAMNNDDLIAAYQWADVVVLPLHENLHASGITVLQEAALLGKPIVCTRTGGLDAYFADDEVEFVPPGSAKMLRASVCNLCVSPDSATAMARRAQARMTARDLNVTSFIQAHVDLSLQVLAKSAQSSSEAASLENPARMAIGYELRSPRSIPARTSN